MMVGRFELRWTYPPKPGALLLEIDARKSQHMWRVCENANVQGYNLRNRVVYLRPKYLSYLLWYLFRISRISAMLCARLRSQNIQVLIASENHDVQVPRRGRLWNRGFSENGHNTMFSEVSRSIPELELLSVQHGQELRRFPLWRRTANVTLLCWGEWAVRNFSVFGRNEKAFVAVGSLVDSLYRDIRPSVISKDTEITLVSTVKGKEWWGQEVGERRQGYEQLAEQVARYATENGISVSVALTIDRDQFGPDDAELERRWFLERLGPSARFTEPSVISGDPRVTFNGRRDPKYVRERYATYFLCDRSNVTIGMASSVLWESFGRGNKLLAVNHTENPIYDFPIDGIWSLRKPTFAEFSERLDTVRSMPQSQWLLDSESARLELMSYEESEPPHQKINRILRESINKTCC